MTHDELERRLRSEPMADSAFVPRALPASAADARAMVGRSPGAGRLLFATAAVAAAAVALVVVMTTFTGAPVGDPGPAASVPASAEASTAAEVEACAAGDLAFSSEAWGAAAGSRGTMVSITLAPSAAPCDLAQHVSARITDGSGAEVARVFQIDPGSEVPVSVERGAVYEIGVTWSNWCGTEPTGPLTLEVAVGGTDWTAVPPPSGTSILVPPCMGGAATTMSVTAIQSAP